MLVRVELVVNEKRACNSFIQLGSRIPWSRIDGSVPLDLSIEEVNVSPYFWPVLGIEGPHCALWGFVQFALSFGFNDK